MRKSSFSPLCYWDRIRLYSIRSLQFCASMKWRTIHAITLHWLLAAPPFSSAPHSGCRWVYNKTCPKFRAKPAYANICLLSCCHISGTNMKTVMMFTWVSVTFPKATWRLSWCDVRCSNRHEHIWMTREKICSQVENPKTFSTSYFLYTRRKLHDQCGSWSNWLSPERSRAQDIHPNPGYIDMKPEIMLKRGLHGIC